MGVVAESMTALVLANEALRKFGGDSLAEVVRNRDGFVASLGTTPSSAVGSPAPSAGPDSAAGMTPRILLVGMMGAGKTTTGQLAGRAPRLGLPGLRRRRRGGHRAHRARALRPRR